MCGYLKVCAEQVSIALPITVFSNSSLSIQPIGCTPVRLSSMGFLAVGTLSWYCLWPTAFTFVLSQSAYYSSDVHKVVMRSLLVDCRSYQDAGFARCNCLLCTLSALLWTIAVLCADIVFPIQALSCRRCCSWIGEYLGIDCNFAPCTPQCNFLFACPVHVNL